MSKTVLKHVVIGVVLGVGGVVLLAVSVAVVVALNMSATQKPGPLDALGHLAWETSLFWRAPDAKNPDQTDAAVAEGLEHYSSSCVYCHGARGVEAAEWATGMLPLPPDLTAQETQERSDGDLCYIVQNGVRMTGPPLARNTQRRRSGTL
jgi:cytochrome c553